MAARLAGWAGRAAFLGIVWGKHIVRMSLKQAASLWGMPPASPQVLPLGEGAGPGPRLWAGLGTFQDAVLGTGSSHSAVRENGTQTEGRCSGRAKIAASTWGRGSWRI